MEEKFTNGLLELTKPPGLDRRHHRTFARAA